MKQVLAFTTLVASACDRQPQQTPAPSAPATAVELGAQQAPSSEAPTTIPMPKDKAEIDRMILAGYTPHGTHLHSPGVKECPLSKGGEAVM